MKKYIKILSAGLLVLLIALSFCSCKELDEMRESVAIYSETEEVLIFRGNEYKLLPKCEYLHIEADDSGNITEKDIPILLSSMYGSYMFFDKNTVFIVGDSWRNGNGEAMVYCRSDRYSEMCQIIENLEMNFYCYWNPYYNSNNSGLTYRGYSLVPDEVAEILQKTLVGEGLEVKKDGTYNVYTEFQCCNETMTLMNNRNIIELGEFRGEYSLMVHQKNNDYLKYSLSSEDALTILNILKLV